MKHNDLMSEKYKKVCRALNYFKHFLDLVFAVSGCASVPAFASLFDVPVGITSSAAGTIMWSITVGILFLSRFSFTNIHNLQDSRRRGSLFL